MASHEDWIFSTTGETDFYMSEQAMREATHLLIINTHASSNLPSILGIELGQVESEESRVGFISSKHILSKPHRLLGELNPMWPIFKYKTTLIAMVNSPPTISNNKGAWQNEWLFNYPPARDIVMHFDHLERIGTLSTFALNRLFTEPIPLPTECAVVRGEELGTDDAPESLQSVWGWLSVQVAHMVGIDSAIYLMPPEQAQTDGGESSVMIPAKFREMCDLLRKDGYKIPRGTYNRAQKIYTEFTSEALERVKELIGATHEKTSNDTGAMFQ